MYGLEKILGASYPSNRSVEVARAGQYGHSGFGEGRLSLLAPIVKGQVRAHGIKHLDDATPSGASSGMVSVGTR
jgi:hypothetical protein